MPARLLSPLLALVLFATACGDSDGEAPATTAAPPPATTAAPSTAPAPTTTAPAPATTTTIVPATTTTTTSTADPFVTAAATLDAVLAECNEYSEDTNGFAPFDGTPDDPTTGGDFTGEVAPGVFGFVDGLGIELLVDSNAGVVTGPEGPDGVAPRPYSFVCPPNVFPGTLDEGEPATVDLLPDGLGIVSFGAGAETVISTLTADLGPPDEDSGWTESFSAFGTCPGEEVRVVSWGELSVFLTDSTTAVGPYPDPGEPHFFSWLAVHQPENPGYGFTTAQGVGPGSTIGDVRAAHGDAVEVLYEEPFDTWFLFIGDDYLGSVADDDPGSVVESLAAGTLCGE